MKKRQKKQKLRRFRSQSEARRVAVQEGKPMDAYIIDPDHDPEKGKVINLEGRAHGHGGPKL